MVWIGGGPLASRLSTATVPSHVVSSRTNSDAPLVSAHNDTASSAAAQARQFLKALRRAKETEEALATTAKALQARAEASLVIKRHTQTTRTTRKHVTCTDLR